MDNIYMNKNKKFIIENFEKLNFNNKYKAINYFFELSDAEGAYELLKKIYKTKLSRKERIQADYLLLIYYIRKDDKFNIDTIKNRLIKTDSKNKMYYELICKSRVDERVEVLKEIIRKNSLKKLFNKRNKNNLIFSYLYSYCLPEETLNIDYINKEINKKIKIIATSKKLDIRAVNFIEYITVILNTGLTLININKVECEIDFNNLFKAIKIAVIERKKFTDFSIEKNKEFYNNMYNGLIFLANVNTIEVRNKKIISDYINEFINNEKDNLKEYVSLSRIKSDENLLDKIRVISTTKDTTNGNLLDLITYAMKIDNQKVQELTDLIDELVVDDNISKDKKNELYIGKEIILLWNEGYFDRDKINKLGIRCYFSEFQELIIKFFDKEITDEEFIFELNNIRAINSYDILSWKMLENKCENMNGYKWLAMILNKLSDKLIKIDYEYFKTFYEDIIFNRKMILLKDFKEINNVLVSKFDNNYYFLVNSLNIFIKYEATDSLKDVIDAIISNFNLINFKVEDKEKYALLLTFLIVDKNIENIKVESLLRIIDSLFIGNKKAFLHFYLKIKFKNIKISKLEYYDIISYLCELYQKEDIDDAIYNIIMSFSNKILENEKVINLRKIDLIYEEKDVLYHEKTNNEILNKAYQIINCEEIKNSDKSQMKQEHLIPLLISRIFFMNVEQKNIGKAISMPENADAKTILLQLEKITGIDKLISIEDKIRNGETVNIPWLNAYDYNKLFEDIVSGRYLIFKNVRNKRLLASIKIIHVSSLFLLAKINRLDVLDDNCYVSYHIYDETIKRNNGEINELGRNILEEAVSYDKELNELADKLEKMKTNSKIFRVSEANILPGKRINVYDDEMIKYVIEKIEFGENFSIIVEDPLWLNSDITKYMSESVVSLLVDAYKNKVLNSSNFLDAIKQLKVLNYNLNIGNILYEYLITKSDDENIKEIIKIINEYKINMM